MIAQAMIEKIALPVHAMFSSDELLPILDGRCHSRFTRERNNRVDMIRHKQAQAAMPDESLVIKPHRGKHGVANGRARHSVRAGRQTQLVFTRRRAVDGYKEPTALGDPLWNRVRQLLAHRQIHALQHTEALRMPKGKR